MVEFRVITIEVSQCLLSITTLSKKVHTFTRQQSVNVHIFSVDLPILQLQDILFVHLQHLTW